MLSTDFQFLPTWNDLRGNLWNDLIVSAVPLLAWLYTRYQGQAARWQMAWFICWEVVLALGGVSAVSRFGALAVAPSLAVLALPLLLLYWLERKNRVAAPRSGSSSVPGSDQQEPRPIAALTETAPIDWTLRDRRQAAYDAYTKFLHVVDLKYELDMDAIRQFVMDMREARFLFGEDIYNYLDTIYSRVLEHRSIRQRMATGANFSSGELASLTDKDNRFTAWLTGQHGEMARRFAPYLDVSERK